MEVSWAEVPDLTLLIRRLQAGDREAEHQFFRVAYRHLRKLATLQLNRESRSADTSAQDLLHDVYLKRIRTWHGSISDRNHYAALVCLALRAELCDRARRRDAQKRTPGPGSEIPPHCAPSGLAIEEILAIDRELERLSRVDERATLVVRLRYYGGCSWVETANAAGASVKEVRNDWEFASDWLAKRLGRKYF